MTDTYTGGLGRPLTQPEWDYMRQVAQRGRVVRGPPGWVRMARNWLIRYARENEGCVFRGDRLHYEKETK